MADTVTAKEMLTPGAVAETFDTSLPVSRTFRNGAWEYTGTKKAAKEPRKAKKTKEG